MTELYLVALRAIHITTAVFWAGGTFLLAGFHDLVVAGEDDEETLRRLAAYAAVSEVVGVAGLVAVVAGLLLYWEVSGALAGTWIRSAYGLTITVGVVAGVAAFLPGALVVGVTNNRVAALDAEVAPGDGLTGGQTERLQRYRYRIRWGDRAVAALLLVAVLAMATAQYL